MSALGDEDVGRLDVAVDDSLGVRRIQRVGNLDAQRQDGLRLHRPAADAVLQRHPVQVLHHQKRLIAVLADLVNGADVGMVEGRGGARLAAEAFQRLRVLRHVIGQELQSHEAAKFSVFGLVDDTHPAPPSFSTMR